MGRRWGKCAPPRWGAAHPPPQQHSGLRGRITCPTGIPSRSNSLPLLGSTNPPQKCTSAPECLSVAVKRLRQLAYDVDAELATRCTRGSGDITERVCSETEEPPEVAARVKCAIRLQAFYRGCTSRSRCRIISRHLSEEMNKMQTAESLQPCFRLQCAEGVASGTQAQGIDGKVGNQTELSASSVERPTKQVIQNDASPLWFTVDVSEAARFQLCSTPISSKHSCMQQSGARLLQQESPKVRDSCRHYATRKIQRRWRAYRGRCSKAPPFCSSNIVISASSSIQARAVDHRLEQSDAGGIPFGAAAACVDAWKEMRVARFFHPLGVLAGPRESRPSSAALGAPMRRGRHTEALTHSRAAGAIQIQAFFRGWAARRRRHLALAAAKRLQTAFRKRRARLLKTKLPSKSNLFSRPASSEASLVSRAASNSSTRRRRPKKVVKAQCVEPLPEPERGSEPTSSVCPFMEISIVGLRRLCDAAKLGVNDCVYDIGSGNGKIVEQLLRRYPCRAIAIEMNPSLAREASKRLSRFGFRARVLVDDVRNVDFQHATAVTAFFTASAMVHVSQHLASSMSPGAVLFNYAYPVPGWFTTRPATDGVFRYVIGEHLTPVPTMEELSKPLLRCSSEPCARILQSKSQAATKSRVLGTRCASPPMTASRALHANTGRPRREKCRLTSSRGSLSATVRSQSSLSGLDGIATR